jgi:hypothetical protein
VNYFTMGFHLQLYPPKLSAWVIVLLVLFLPATLTAYFLHNLAWLVVVPFGIIFLVLFIAALPLKRKVTPAQFADELESHLLGLLIFRTYRDLPGASSFVIRRSSLCAWT